MERVQRDLLSVLLGRLREEGLLSHSICSGAVDLVYSVKDISELLRYPVCLTAEADAHEYSQDPQ